MKKIVTASTKNRPAPALALGARLLALPGLLALLAAPPVHAQAWKVTWADEFNYTGIPDTTKWNYEHVGARNNEPQYYTVRRPENARVDNGTLKLTVRKEKYEGWEYTSAHVNTKQIFEPIYGRIEARIKAPEGKAGVWPAFWMLGNRNNEMYLKHADETVDWPAPGSDEIDIWEYFGKSPNDYLGNLLIKDNNGCNGGVNRISYTDGQSPQDWHVYGLEWFPDSIRFTMNGKVMAVNRQSAGCTQLDGPLFYMLNFAIGGDAGGPLASDLTFPQVLEVDWIRYSEDTLAKHTRLYTTPLGLGTVSPVSSGRYTRGQQATLTASPRSGWKFSGWKGDASGSQNPLTLTLNGDKKVEALFEPLPGRNLALDGKVEGGTSAGGMEPGKAVDADTGTGWAGDAGDSTRNWLKLEWPAYVKFRKMKLRLQDVASWTLDLYYRQALVRVGQGTQSLADLDLGEREGKYVLLKVKPLPGKKPVVKDIGFFAEAVAPSPVKTPAAAASSKGKRPAPGLWRKEGRLIDAKGQERP